MMQGRQTMMIELILVDGTRGGDALLAGDPGVEPIELDETEPAPMPAGGR
jgi:hypothetical protein